jgi:hypothetical protein
LAELPEKELKKLGDSGKEKVAEEENKALNLIKNKFHVK